MQAQTAAPLPEPWMQQVDDTQKLRDRVQGLQANCFTDTESG